MRLYKSKIAQKNILSTYNKLIKQWDVEIVSIDVPTRYGSTHIHVFGQPGGTPVVLFHGVGDDSALMWIYNAKALAGHFQVYAVDTIGGPGKSIPNVNYNKNFDDSLWIDDVLDGLKLDSAHLAGTSHGGYLVQYYALTRPERVRKAVCMAGSVPGGEAGNPMKTIIKIFFPEALFPTSKNIVKLLKKLTGSNHAAFTENPLILEHFTYLLRGFNNMAMGYHKIIGFTDEQIDSIRGKVLYLIGEADPFAQLGGKALLEHYQMNTRFFKNVGHGINHEIADTINALLIQYFSESEKDI